MDTEILDSFLQPKRRYNTAQYNSPLAAWWTFPAGPEGHFAQTECSKSPPHFAQSKLVGMTLPSWGHRRVLGLWLLVPPEDIWRIMKAQVLKARIPINFKHNLHKPFKLLEIICLSISVKPPAKEIRVCLSSMIEPFALHGRVVLQRWYPCHWKGQQARTPKWPGLASTSSTSLGSLASVPLYSIRKRFQHLISAPGSSYMFAWTLRRGKLQTFWRRTVSQLMKLVRLLAEHLTCIRYWISATTFVFRDASHQAIIQDSLVQNEALWRLQALQKPAVKMCEKKLNGYDVHRLLLALPATASNLPRWHQNKISRMRILKDTNWQNTEDLLM